MLEAPILIQGQKPQSKDELMVAAALDKLDYDYIYQFEIFGGTHIRGGQVIDFLVFTVPLSTPLYVNGRYWHEGENRGEQDLKITEMEAATRGQFAKAVIIWDDEFNTVDEAMQLLRSRL